MVVYLRVHALSFCLFFCVLFFVFWGFLVKRYVVVVVVVVVVAVMIACADVFDVMWFWVLFVHVSCGLRVCVRVCVCVRMCVRALACVCSHRKTCLIIKGWCRNTAKY